MPRGKVSKSNPYRDGTLNHARWNVRAKYRALIKAAKDSDAKKKLRAKRNGELDKLSDVWWKKGYKGLASHVAKEAKKASKTAAAAAPAEKAATKTKKGKTSKSKKASGNYSAK